jgi:muramoyltetrapeptide carboxypeptidase
MITPKYLKPGDKIGLIAPSRSIETNEIDKAIHIFESYKIRVVLGPNIYKKQNQFAGSDQDRAADLQKFLDNPEIKAVLCVRGGYGSVRTLEYLNFDKFIKNPKWIAGYSDITVFHSFINTNLGVETIHSPMPFNFIRENADQESVSYFIDLLFGKVPDYHIESHKLNCDGEAKGVLTGGNLSVLYSLRGTPADIDTKNKILFIEDIDEYLYHIDRMMMNFKYGNKFTGLKGVLVGEFTEMKDNAVPFGKNAYEIISEFFSEMKIPVCFGFPAGHGKKNWPLIMGREITLEVGKSCSLRFNQ